MPWHLVTISVDFQIKDFNCKAGYWLFPRGSSYYRFCSKIFEKITNNLESIHEASLNAYYLSQQPGLNIRLRKSFLEKILDMIYGSNMF